MANPLTARLDKLEAKVAPSTPAERRVFRIVTHETDEQLIRLQMIEAGWNPEGNDLCIVRRIVTPASVAAA